MPYVLLELLRFWVVNSWFAGFYDKNCANYLKYAYGGGLIALQYSVHTNFQLGDHKYFKLKRNKSQVRPDQNWFKVMVSHTFS